MRSLLMDSSSHVKMIWSVALIIVQIAFLHLSDPRVAFGGPNGDRIRERFSNGAPIEAKPRSTSETCWRESDCRAGWKCLHQHVVGLASAACAPEPACPDMQIQHENQPGICFPLITPCASDRDCSVAFTCIQAMAEGNDGHFGECHPTFP